MAEKIKVLIIDDSALIRELLSKIIGDEPDMVVIDKAADAYFAVEKIKRNKPDVITLDVEMPKVNGLVFLENLMKSNPLPVIMISSLTEKGSEATIKALQLGAFDYIAKPKSDISSQFSNLKDEIVSKIRMAAEIKNKFAERRKTVKSFVNKKIKVEKPTGKIIVMGASTGGVEAISTILKQMPDNIPPTVIVQHMPAKFVFPFVKRLNTYFNFTVKIAEEGEFLKSGKVLISPGDKHVELKKLSSGIQIKYNDGPLVNNHKPSVDILFRSVATEIGDKAIAVLLTGMGKDGAKGMKMIKEAGGITIAQDKESSIVFGMPGEAIRINGAAHIINLNEIPASLSQYF